RRMGRIEWQIDEERLVALLLDHIDGMVGEVVDEKTLPLHDPAVVLQHRAEVLPPVAGAEPVVFVEAAAAGVIGILHPVVPLAEAGRPLTGGAKRVGEGPRVELQTYAAGGGPLDAAPRATPPGQRLRPRRRADGAAA